MEKVNINKLSSLTLFFPFYNEEENIVKVVESAIDIANKVALKYEVLAIDDGSRDNTPKLADELAMKYPGVVKAIHNNPNKGYGGAVKAGYENAQNDWIFSSDGDGQFNLEELVNFIPYTKENDAVIGYRIKRADPFFRLINAKLWALFIRVLFGLKVNDIDCAFKLINKKVIDSFDFKSDGATVTAELLVMTNRNGFKIQEVGVNHYPRQAGTATGANPKVIIKAFKNALILKQAIH